MECTLEAGWAEEHIFTDPVIDHGLQLHIKKRLLRNVTCFCFFQAMSDGWANHYRTWTRATKKRGLGPTEKKRKVFFSHFKSMPALHSIEQNCMHHVDKPSSIQVWSIEPWWWIKTENLKSLWPLWALINMQWANCLLFWRRASIRMPIITHTVRLWLMQRGANNHENSYNCSLYHGHTNTKVF